MELVDTLISRGYPLQEIRKFTITQLLVFSSLSFKRIEYLRKEQATTIRMAVWSEDKRFREWLTN